MPDARPFDAVAPRYDSIYGDKPCRTEDEALLRRLTPHLRSSRRVLDVGCGTGWLLDRADSLVGEYVGMDISTELLRMARLKHPGEDRVFTQGDMSGPWPLDGLGAPFQANLVVSLWCAASYAPARHFMAEAARSLAPGGTVVAMPHASGAVIHGESGVRGDRYLPPECYNGSTGWRPWGATEALRAAEAAGLSIREISGFRASPELPDILPLPVHRLARRFLRPCPADDAAFLLVIAGRL